jgi:hypothetical protein
VSVDVVLIAVGVSHCDRGIIVGGLGPDCDVCVLSWLFWFLSLFVQTSVENVVARLVVFFVDIATCTYIVSDTDVCFF